MLMVFWNEIKHLLMNKMFYSSIYEDVNQGRLTGEEQASRREESTNLQRGN